MTRPTPEDGDEAFAEWSRLQDDDVNRWCYAALDEVEGNMRSTGIAPDRVRLVQGRVEDTIPEAAPERIAVLRLDTDWYQSTYHELRHLFPRLSPEGVLIIDDYGRWDGARQAVDRVLRGDRGAHPAQPHRPDGTNRGPPCGPVRVGIYALGHAGSPRPRSRRRRWPRRAGTPRITSPPIARGSLTPARSRGRRARSGRP